MSPAALIPIFGLQSIFLSVANLTKDQVSVQVVSYISSPAGVNLLNQSHMRGGIYVMGG